ncbi:hypothetical protein SKAU_G00258960 [Synaphobranchus kaupii]|uniref:Alpha-crystallin A chain n=1 Tax=Synaphobranchus kaupii TaxID=118154 RepID=A0A9Q1IRQ9_SYNKA|nr:hypothetical protein SKAU_G00258960 [Synaphobranchus kaupii]
MDITIQHPWFRRHLGSVYPPRLFDQYFGEGMYDFLPYGTTTTISPYYKHSTFRNLLDSSNSGISEVRSDRDKFTIYLDVKHFSPEDLSVKIVDDYVEIQGKHGERQDDHGFISREFVRRYPPALQRGGISSHQHTLRRRPADHLRAKGHLGTRGHPHRPQYPRHPRRQDQLHPLLLGPFCGGGAERAQGGGGC